MFEIRKKNFLDANNIVSIQSTSFRELGRLLGKIASTAAKRTVSDISNPTDIGKATSLLAFAENLATTDACVIQNRNVLRDYLDLLYGYCEGAGISKEEGSLLQVEIESGCQTVLIQDQTSKSIGFIHMEENFDDRELGELYKFMDIHQEWNPTMPLPENLEKTYIYKIVTSTIGTETYTFFAYPGLCFGGPAMGYNHQKNAIITVDTISPIQEFREQSLWANSIATMAFLLGDIPSIKLLMQKLTSSHIHIVNGYSIHVAEAKSLTMTSFEVGGDTITEVPPDIHNNLSVVIQPNLPRSTFLLSIDELYINNTNTDTWTKQFALEMIRRIDALHEKVDLNKLTFDASFPEQMSIWAHTCRGDLETDMYTPEWKSFTGLISPFVAGYLTGIFTPKETIVEFGKFYPYNSLYTRPRLWYSGDTDMPHGSNDLLKLVKSGKSDPTLNHS